MKLRYVIHFLLVISLLCFSIPIWLPSFYNAFLKKIVESQWIGLQCELDSIDHNSLVIKSFQYEKDGILIKANKAELNFNWWSMLKEQHLKEVTVFDLVMERKEGVNKNKSAVSEEKVVDLPCSIESLQFINSTVLLDSSQQIKVPLILGKISQDVQKLDVQFPLLNQQVELSLELKLKENGFPFVFQLNRLIPNKKETLIRGHGDTSKVIISWMRFSKPIDLTWLSSGGGHLKLDEKLIAKVEGETLKGELNQLKSLPQGSQVDWEIDIALNEFFKGSIRSTFPKFVIGGFTLEEISAQLYKTKDSVWTLSANALKLSSETLTVHHPNLSIPLEKTTKKGFVKAKVEEVNLGEVEVNFEVDHRESFVISGNLDLSKLGMYGLPVSVTTSIDEKAPGLYLESNFENRDLSVFTEEFGLFEGHLSASVNATLQVGLSLEHGFEQQFHLDLYNGFFANQDLSVTTNGLEASLHSDRLLSKSTGPSQVLKWRSFKGNGMEFVDGEVFWQWEKEQKLFIESLKMNWCGGKLSLMPMRLETSKKDFDVTFFCERVQLAQVLKAFQVGDVEGEGELGGKISLAYLKGKWEFEDTYLYSDPAREGRLVIKEAQLLDQAMSQSQLQLARESLKDYNYKWAKLNFVSENENLLIKLVMDGKPNGLLPFRFDPKTAQFVYDEASPGVHLQGLKLNTNFRSEQFMPLLERSLNLLKKIELGD